MKRYQHSLLVLLLCCGIALLSSSIIRNAVIAQEDTPTPPAASPDPAGGEASPSGETNISPISAPRASETPSPPPPDDEDITTTAPNAVPQADIPPTEIPDSSPVPSELLADVTEEAEQPIPSSTDSPETGSPGPEASALPEVSPEATEEPEVTGEESSFDLAYTCTAEGVEFVLTNLGADMAESLSYLLDDLQTGEALLAAGESITISAGYGTPRLTFASLDLTVETPCERPTGLVVTARCTLEDGVIFTVKNYGEAMESEQEYTVEPPNGDSFSDTFQLGEEETVEIYAQYGAPILWIDEASTQPESDCLPPSTIEGHVWQDTNGDGLYTEDEPGFPDVTVTLRQNDGSSEEATTLEDGAYSFVLVAAGSYTLEIRPDALPPEWQIEVDPDDEMDATTTLDVAPGQLYTFDFGYGLSQEEDAQEEGAASIQGVVWLETSNWGTHDAGEMGPYNVMVELVDSNSVVVRTIPITPTGDYRFEGLLPGSYVVRVVYDTLPQPFGVTFESDGSKDLETPVSVETDQTIQDINFGIVGTF